MPVHQHRFTLVTHIDGCHFYTSHYACGCGAYITTYDERDPREDPYSMVWMEPSYQLVTRDKRGRFVKPHEEIVECERCNELINGAEPIHEQEKVEA